MANYTFVCWRCLTSCRADVWKTGRKCSSCGRDMECRGTKLRIPPKTDRHGWDNLRRLVREQKDAVAHNRTMARDMCAQIEASRL